MTLTLTDEAHIGDGAYDIKNGKFVNNHGITVFAAANSLADELKGSAGVVLRTKEGNPSLMRVTSPTASVFVHDARKIRDEE